jgi:hypothetical protein
MAGPLHPGNDGIPQHAGAANTSLAPWVARARKFLVGAAGLGAQVVASGVLDDAEDAGVRLWVQAGLAVLTAAGIYRVPNAPTR